MNPDFESLAREALTQPGKLSTAYNSFWEYSPDDQVLAMIQLPVIEPIASFQKWKELGQHVRKGEKDIALLMPVFRISKKIKVLAGKDRHRRYNSEHRFGLHRSQADRIC